jgi:hypothetical protein
MRLPGTTLSNEDCFSGAHTLQLAVVTERPTIVGITLFSNSWMISCVIEVWIAKDALAICPNDS